MAYHSIYGKLFGVDTLSGTPLVQGRPVGVFPVGMGRGNTFYVDSNVGASDGTSPGTAVGTLAAAIAKCTANQGDVIVVMPLHVENVAGAAAIAINVAGISIIGLGYGNQRPKFTLTAAAATITVSAAGVYIENCIFSANFLNITSCFVVTAVDFWLNRCTFKNTAASKNFLNPINCTTVTTGTVDGLRVVSCRWLNGAETVGYAMIATLGTADSWIIADNFMVSSCATSNSVGTEPCLIYVSTGKILTNTQISWNKVYNKMTADELFISNDGTTNTGIIENNYVGHADVTGTHDPGWDAGGWRLFANLSTSVDNLQGLAIPTTDVNL